MKYRTAVCLIVGPIVGLAWSVASVAEVPMVRQSAREIPVARSVDVVVVGGSTGAVSAAVAAAESGAKVFLAAPRPYLGEDMTATLQLWLEEGETPESPLAKALYHDAQGAADRPSRNRVPFTYEADQPSADKHRDTAKPSLLADLKWGEPTRQSVQYDEDVNIVADLGKTRDVAGVNIWAYDSYSPNGYRIKSVTISTSDDGKSWQQAAVIVNKPGIGESSPRLTAKLSGKARYLKFFVKKDLRTPRILLGEIEVLAPRIDGQECPELAPWPRPMHVKRTLDQALLDAGVDFLYNCYATDVLTDAEGRPCGIVMSNRAGRQAVVAKTIIDATERAVVARMAGAEFRPFPAGEHSFRRVVIGGQPHSGPGMTSRVIEPAFTGAIRKSEDTGVFPIIEYTLTLPMKDDSEASWAEADQQARTRTYDPGQQFTSDVLFQVPRDAMVARKSSDGEWPGADRLPLEVLRPKKVEGIFVLGGCADVSREQAEELMRPLALINLGKRVGTVAAKEAKQSAAPAEPRLRGTALREPAAEGDVREILAGDRPEGSYKTLPQEAGGLPVWGRYDVVVVGGGTAGAPAGIAAAQQGARTLVVEKLCGLGGVGTTGAICNYCQGNRVGFTSTVGGGNTWVIEQKMEWWRSTLLEAGADIWFGAIGCGAVVDQAAGNQVVGVVVATPRGRGVVLARVVVDATGGADVAAAAGAECVTTSESEFAMQGTGLPPRELGAGYTNTDYTFTDETDMVDIWQLLVYAREKFSGAFDLGQLIDTRERRRIVGDYTLTILDQISERTFPDTIAKAYTSYDTHGYIVAPYLLLRHPLRQKFTSYVPYRCLLPKGMDGLLVTGIGLSAHRDAQPIVRMEPDIQNQGYAAGAAAAMAAKARTAVRYIDIRALQKHLVEIGNLSKSVLTDEDSYPLPREKVAAAVADVDGDYRNLAVVLGQWDAARPMVEKAYEAASGEKKLIYAKVLGMMGDATGAQTLIEEVRKIDKWDSIPAWNIGGDYAGYVLVGWGMSNLDNTLVSLGHTRQAEAVPAVLEKLAILRPQDSFSHHRAVYRALELLGDRRAAEPLAAMLQTPGMGGYAVTSIDQRADTVHTKSQATRELQLARALYRCGDYEGLGEKTLKEYSKDLRGHFARHATAVLEAGKDYRAAGE